MNKFYKISVQELTPSLGSCSGFGVYEEGTTASLVAFPISSDFQAVWKVGDVVGSNNLLFLNNIHEDITATLEFVPKNEFPIHIDYN